MLFLNKIAHFITLNPKKWLTKKVGYGIVSQHSLLKTTQKKGAIYVPN